MQAANAAFALILTKEGHMIRNFRTISLIAALATVVSACSYLPLPESAGEQGAESADLATAPVCPTPTPEAAAGVAASGQTAQGAADPAAAIGIDTENIPSGEEMSKKLDDVNPGGPALKGDDANAPAGAPIPGTESGPGDGDVNAFAPIPTSTPCP